jgi:hypothetical protein
MLREGIFDPPLAKDKEILIRTFNDQSKEAVERALSSLGKDANGRVYRDRIVLTSEQAPGAVAEGEETAAWGKKGCKLEG